MSISKCSRSFHSANPAVLCPGQKYQDVHLHKYLVNFVFVYPEGGGVLAHVLVELLGVLAVARQLGGQVEVLVLHFVIQCLHVELLKLYPPRYAARVWRHERVDKSNSRNGKNGPEKGE